MEKENNLKKFKYIVYETKNLINNKIYVGVHQTENPDVYDHYLGCGAYDNLPYTYNKAKFSFHKALIKYGPKNFVRTTLAVFDSPGPAYLLEEDIVNEDFLKRDDVYNMVLGGEGGYFISKRLKVYYYDLDGYYVGEFDSMAIAGLNLGCDYTAISYAVRKKTKCCGYYWSTDKLQKIDLKDYNVCDNHRVPVYCYDKFGNYLEDFKSQTEASLNKHVSTGSISDSCKSGVLVKKEYYFSTIKAANYSIARSEYVKTRPVFKYTSDGNFVEAYEHQRDAEKANAGSNISKAIRTKTVCKNGFLWGLDRLEVYNKPRKNLKRRVGKYDLQGNLVKIYESATAAEKENGTSVWKVLAGTNSTHKQHIYKYLSS